MPLDLSTVVDLKEVSPASPDDPSPFLLDITIDHDSGSLIVHDPRAFQDRRRAFCRRLLDAVLEREGVRKAEIHLGAATCRVEFDAAAATPRRMADVFGEAVRQAIRPSAAISWPTAWKPGGRWEILTGYRAQGDFSLWETFDPGGGRVRLRHPAIRGDRSRVPALVDTLARLEPVRDCRISAWTRTLTIDLIPDIPADDNLVDLVESVLEDWKGGRPPRHDLLETRHDGGHGPVGAGSGRRRLLYLALAGGSMALTLVGLIIPGIPTVPFLLATSYYLARSWPWLDDRLRGTPIFGQVLDEWEREHGLSRSSKLRLAGLTLSIVLLTAALTTFSPVALALLGVVSVLSIYGVHRMPGLPDESPRYLSLDSPKNLALTAG